MSKGRYHNRRAEKKIESISKELDLLSPENDITIRSKINFSYLDTSQSSSYDFRDLTKEILCDIFGKIKEHGKKSLDELSRTPIGGGSKGIRRNIFKIYNEFPPRDKTDFKEPTYIPHQVKWGAIRITGAFRLAGFIIPPEYHKQTHPGTNEIFDKNTFYVVFIDKEHKFWKCEK